MSAARARITRAIASALRGDEETREFGRGHALLGLPWSCPEGADMLSYSLGYADGKTERMCRSRERAEPERSQ